VKLIGETLSVLHERSVLDAPVGIEMSADVTTGQSRLSLANETGHEVTYYAHWTAGRQVQ
jgi:hypothetical protein